MKSPRNKTITITDNDLAAFKDFKAPTTMVQENDLGNTLWFGSCLDLMKFMPNESIDLIIADPPYLLNKNFGQGTIAAKTLEEYRAWTEAWITECLRTLKQTGTLYVCSDWHISGVIQEILERHAIVQNRITWKRDKGRGAKNNWKNNAEDIWFATKSNDYTFNLNDVKTKKEVIAPYVDALGNPKDWFAEGDKKYRFTCPSNIWDDITVPFWSMPENTEHPTQKPEKLVERLIRASSSVGDLVFDPFLGSGTTAVMAKKTGRRYAGCEMEPRYYILTHKRLGLYKPTVSLF